MNLNCPNCGNENTQKLSLAVASGTFSNRSVSMGAGFTGSGVGVGGGASRGTSTSKFAEQYAEPQKMQPIKMFIAVLILAGFAALFVGSIAITIGFWVGILASLLSIYNNVKVYPREHAEWNSKFLCHRCSMVFTPSVEVVAETAADKEGQLSAN